MRISRPRRTYRVRNGLAAGLRRHGGLGLRDIVPFWPSASPQEEAFLAARDFRGATIFDVGGFEGILTIFFAARAGSDGRVVAFEPHPANQLRLRANVELNGLTNVVLRPVAVGARAGELAFVVGSNRARTSADPAIQADLLRESPSARTISVQVVALDDEVASGRAPEPDFVKIDVEGLEVDVLEGSRGLLERLRPDLFVELHGSEDLAERTNGRRVAELLAAHGYAIEHVESGRRVDDPREAPVTGHLFASAR